jgi:hypothetical protein
MTSIGEAYQPHALRLRDTIGILGLVHAVLATVASVGNMSGVAGGSTCYPGSRCSGGMRSNPLSRDAAEVSTDEDEANVLGEATVSCATHRRGRLRERTAQRSRGYASTASSSNWVRARSSAELSHPRRPAWAAACSRPRNVISTRSARATSASSIAASSSRTRSATRSLRLPHAASPRPAPRRSAWDRDGRVSRHALPVRDREAGGRPRRRRDAEAAEPGRPRARRARSDRAELDDHGPGGPGPRADAGVVRPSTGRAAVTASARPSRSRRS